MKHEGLSRILEELRTVHKLSTRLMIERCQNMTPEQVKLMMLIHKERLSQKEISEKLHITEATLSVRIKRLVDSGLVEREIDSDDKRKYVIVLSSLGEEMVNEIQKAFEHTYQVICRGMTSDDYDAILSIIKRIQKNIKEEIE